MEKKWYEIKFDAQLDDADLNTLEKHLFDMLEEMGIYNCYGLNVKNVDDMALKE